MKAAWQKIAVAVSKQNMILNKYISELLERSADLGLENEL
jgi:hypothetical protein